MMSLTSAAATAPTVLNPFSQNTRAVLLLMNGICARANRSAFAPEFKKVLATRFTGLHLLEINSEDLPARKRS